ncbi:MAG: SDR family NAD(P)-dependent oxidoreductase, partial [Burkholderiales bacterium]
MTQDLADRVAIVSGGARGIGLAIVEELAANGAHVVIVDAGVSISGEADDPRIAQRVAATLA